MPITPKEILEEIDRDFNSTELQTILELEYHIDYILLSTYTINNDVYVNNILSFLKSIHPNRHVKVLQNIFDTYSKLGWKVWLDTKDVIIFHAKSK